MNRLLAALLVWPPLILLAVPAYAVGLVVIVRDLWRRRRGVRHARVSY